MRLLKANNYVLSHYKITLDLRTEESATNLSKLEYENDVINNALHNPEKNNKIPCALHYDDCRPKDNELEGIPQEDEMDY